MGAAAWGTHRAVATLRRQWDWLRELLLRGRGPARTPYELGTGARSRPATRVEALRDALGQLGLGDAALVEGVAEALRLPVARFREPIAATLLEVEADDLAVILPLLAEHRSKVIAAIGRTWLTLPETIYAIAADQGEQWLLDSGVVGDLLAPRVAGEGLAWLGPEALQRVAQRASSASARDAARGWVARLEVQP